MPAQMTKSAWLQGRENALICTTAFLALWCAFAALISWLFDRPGLEAFVMAFAVLWGVVLIAFLGTWWHGRIAAGRVLLECGPHPMRRTFLLQGIFVLALVVLLQAITGFNVFGIEFAVFALSFGGYWLIMATGRLQVREHGIWQYWRLLRWDAIGSHRWTNDSTLFVQPKGYLGLSGALPVPPEHRQAVEEFFAERSANYYQRPAAPMT
jgi:hypothetical protein